MLKRISFAFYLVSPASHTYPNSTTISIATVFLRLRSPEQWKNTVLPCLTASLTAPITFYTDSPFPSIPFTFVSYHFPFCLYANLTNVFSTSYT